MPSCIATIDATLLDDQPGYVLLGKINGVAYIHLSPGHRPNWAEQAVVLYDPSPSPFAWEEFASQYPVVASQLMPHRWVGESDE